MAHPRSVRIAGHRSFIISTEKLLPRANAYVPSSFPARGEPQDLGRHPVHRELFEAKARQLGVQPAESRDPIDPLRAFDLDTLNAMMANAMVG